MNESNILNPIQFEIYLPNEKKTLKYYLVP